MNLVLVNIGFFVLKRAKRKSVKMDVGINFEIFCKVSQCKCALLLKDTFVV